jgi:hypothetical protein
LELPLEFGNPAPEIGHHVLGKRGHALNPFRPGFAAPSSKNP